MFKRLNKLQYNVEPERPDPLMARRLQEAIGGQWGEMTGMTSYLFQAWNTVGKENHAFKDLLLDTGTEEIGHIEMLANMISMLLKDSPVNVQENVYKANDAKMAAVLSGMDPNHGIVNGLGANLNNPNGTPWTAAYMNASGNLLADMRFNVTRESMGRLQVTRLYHMTEDEGIRDMLAFLMARETQHQLQFIEAAEELEKQYGVVVPYGTKGLEHSEFNHTVMNFSEGEASGEFYEGRTAKDGEPFKYEQDPQPHNGMGAPAPAPEDIRNTQGEITIAQGKKLIEDLSHHIGR